MPGFQTTTSSNYAIGQRHGKKGSWIISGAMHFFAREDVLDDLEKCEHPQVVALTTCTSEFTDARTVVLAQMIPEKDADREE